MFNGIIRSLGYVKEIITDPGLTTLTINCPGIAAKLAPGDSVAVDGVCLTVKEHNRGGDFTVEIMPETLDKTIIGLYSDQQKVNLELPMKLGERLDGHFTYGHVDFRGTVNEIKKHEKTMDISIDIPSSYRKYIALKGSVAVNGVSLTVSGIDNTFFTVSVIPQTLKMTNLSLLKKGDCVNVETDMIARYLDSLLENRENQVTYAFLKERNFI